MKREEFAAEGKIEDRPVVYPMHTLKVGQLWNSLTRMDFGFEELARFSIRLESRHPVRGSWNCAIHQWQDTSMLMLGVSNYIELNEEEIRRNFLIFFDVDDGHLSANSSFISNPPKCFKRRDEDPDVKYKPASAYGALPPEPEDEIPF